jgi:7 transmembrane receptor (rhodopsin family)
MAKNNSSLILTDHLEYDLREFKLPLFIKLTTFCGCAVVLSATVLNLIVLITFLRRPRLITSFTIHVVNNTILEIIAASVFSPMFLYRNLDREIYRQNVYCAMYKYLNWTLPSMLLLQHAIISLDRWLAILAPLWYRDKKTTNMAIAATIGAFLYVQLWFIPLFIADTLRPKLTGTFCDNTASWPRYQLAVRLATAILPVVLMDLSYPFLIFMVWKHTRPQVHAEPLVQNKTVKKTSQQRSNRHMGMAMWLLMVQMVLWTPSNVTNMLIGMRSQLPYLYDVHTFAVVLSGVLLLADPIIYLAFLKDLRKELVTGLRALWTCNCSG